MEAFGDWWEGLSTILKIYWGIAVPFTLFFVLQLVLSFLGAESPDDLPDAEIDADHGIPFQFLTLKNLIGFFTIFSWTGIACIEAGYSNTTSLIIATIAGLLMMSLMAGMFYLMTKSGADGTMKIQNAIGQTGEVYLTIQASRKGVGKVQVKVSGALRTLDAMTDDVEPLNSGQLARVTQIINDNILLVTSK
ncbi:MAG TPA: hypothetical protein DHV26_02500 [Cytophagales bacterium]|nr:hypothetical protein [Cytophagales bacterium]HRG09282.1 hypothetical protein [Cyclobacteriaceae bacterium]